jgi:tetratricopeptide (TPR) repeat protein
VTSRRAWFVTLAAGAVLAAGSTRLVAVRVSRDAPVRDEARIRDANLTFYDWRLRRDPTSAFDLAQLASLHLQRGRERGDPENVVRAEALARRSLANRDTRNARGYATLVSALMTQHRFTEARTVARRLVALDSTSVSARAVLAEVEMELGHYDIAREQFGALYRSHADLAVAPRLARWLELQGQGEAARRLLTAALDSARARLKLPREQVAWLHLRIGDLELRSGQLGAAQRAFQAGLAVAPADARLLAAMARVAAARARWADVIRYGEAAVAVAPDPATLGLIGEGYAAQGDSANAEQFYGAMEAVTLAQPGTFHRAWSLFLLDHQRRIPEVLARVQDEVLTRRDIYGWDLLGWALHRAGRDREALPAIAKAMALGTQDAMLFYHRGMIELALGHRVAARSDLERALAINPFFSPSGAREARAVLAGL